VFSRINLIMGEETSTETRCDKTLLLLLTFTERNPGITRILTGDPLSGETDRLRTRVAQFFDRVELQLKQILRESEIRGGQTVRMETSAAANFMLALVEGKISQFVRSDFKRRPTDGWSEQWQQIRNTLFE